MSCSLAENAEVLCRTVQTPGGLSPGNYSTMDDGYGWQCQSGGRPLRSRLKYLNNRLEYKSVSMVPENES